MAATILPTARLELVLQTPDELLARIESMSPEDRAQVSPDWLARVRTVRVGDVWALGFTITERDGGRVVGDCGYTGPPNGDGYVEIAYSVEPDRRGRGYATEAAQALVAFAFTHEAVRVVCAHTLPETNASTRILNKCGFRHLGEIAHPEDGLVWRWEKPRADAAPS